MPQKQTTLRPPGKPSTGLNWSPPRIDWLEGTWHVTHSTLPLWKSKKNVQITYKSLPQRDGTTPSGTHRLDDLVSYQDLSSDTVRTVHGIDTSSSNGDTGAWDWRGTGLLFLLTSHWEVLGWGDSGSDGDGDNDGADSVSIGGECSSSLPVPEMHVDWVVTYFAKTFFTPAGIDIYSRSQKGLSPKKVARVIDALNGVDDEDVRRLVGGIFEVMHDVTRLK
ncbi:MAG: hypothetical protein M1840_005373 [Geoglossum simile]|nr:MAG: hypothetical protein M1840_005373 [Geoglossum simile]